MLLSKKVSLQKGFSLMEMIVAVGVFAIVAVIAVGALLILTAVEAKVSGNQTNQDNVRFALEAMAREIRTGQDYSTSACVSPCIQFTNIAGSTVIYSLNSVDHTIERTQDGGQPYALTAKEAAGIEGITVESLSFFVHDVGVGGKFQPRVTIAIKAITPNADPRAAVLALETTVSQFELQR